MTLTNAVIHAEESTSGHSELGGLAGDPSSFLGAAVPNTFYLNKLLLETVRKINGENRGCLGQWRLLAVLI